MRRLLLLAHIAVLALATMWYHCAAPDDELSVSTASLAAPVHPLLWRGLNALVALVTRRPCSMVSGERATMADVDALLEMARRRVGSAKWHSEADDDDTFLEGELARVRARVHASTRACICQGVRMFLDGIHSADARLSPLGFCLAREMALQVRHRVLVIGRPKGTKMQREMGRLPAPDSAPTPRRACQPPRRDSRRGDLG